LPVLKFTSSILRYKKVILILSSYQENSLA